MSPAPAATCPGARTTLRAGPTAGRGKVTLKCSCRSSFKPCRVASRSSPVSPRWVGRFTTPTASASHGVPRCHPRHPHQAPPGRLRPPSLPPGPAQPSARSSLVEVKRHRPAATTTSGAPRQRGTTGGRVWGRDAGSHCPPGKSGGEATRGRRGRDSWQGPSRRAHLMR